MNIFHSIILGIIEGITEFLPISSTAHLEITSKIIGLAQSEFVKSFEISIQLGAILAVVVLYAKLLTKYRRIWKPIIIAFIPTAIIGFLLYKIIKSYLLGNNWLIVTTLFIGGFILIYFEHWSKKTNQIKPSLNPSDEIANMRISTAVYIGLAQSLAVVPGVSRSAATIIAGRFLGLSRVAIVEFSFLLAIPTMTAATYYDLLKNANSFNTNQYNLLLVGFVTAFISAIFTISFLLRYIKNHSFVAFGIYRILIAVVFALFLLIS